MLRIGSWIAATLLAGCAARVPLTVPAAPAVAVPDAAVSVVVVDRECREIADLLADHLGALPGMSVRPDAPTRLDVYACTVGWHPLPSPHTGVRGAALAVVAVTSAEGEPPGPLVAHLIGASRSAHPSRVPRGAVEALREDVARDLAEQIAPVNTLVRRRVYADPADGSARQFHNLAVQAEARGRLADAVWWATQAWERQPNPRRARYLAELTRRLSRAGGSSTR